MVPRCVEFLHDVAARAAARRANPKQFTSEDSVYENWMLYCSVNIPHPAFETNATWLEYVHSDRVTVPTVQAVSEMHPYDTYMSTSKVCLEKCTENRII